jgi:hypothetical protein
MLSTMMGLPGKAKLLGGIKDFKLKRFHVNLSEESTKLKTHNMHSKVLRDVGHVQGSNVPKSSSNDKIQPN